MPACASDILTTALGQKDTAFAKAQVLQCEFKNALWELEALFSLKTDETRNLDIFKLSTSWRLP
ncbi:hypothetical protein ACPOL_7242 (plasmid) [Acidisarcina polymorpha]|uniref:Uncharacterized protein n=1 Tax=Acidisarcina polymorpha TaxID=2211140 RepID=A0A2Z5GB09_9BACT|nr:hypothetical protein ACPOL_7242 [Acidisarcina polymorpha]